MDFEWERKFLDILDKDEKILWKKKPSYVPYMFEQIKGFLFVIIALPYIAYSTWGLIQTTQASQEYYLLFCAFMVLAMIVIGVVAVLLFWGGIESLFSYSNVSYVLTNKRVISSTGINRIRFSSIFYDKIKGVDLFRKATQNLFGTATIGIKLATNMSGMYSYSKILLIDNKDTDIVCEIIKQHYFGGICHW